MRSINCWIRLGAASFRKTSPLRFNIGINVGEAVGQTLFSLSHPPDPAPARRCCKTARQGPGRYSREAILLTEGNR